MSSGSTGTRISFGMSDAGGHQLPQVIYPGILDEGEMMEWVARFYDEYYFRPKTAWRIVRKAMFDGPERKRLYKEAKEYMALRKTRKQYVVDHKANLLSKATAAAQDRV